MPLYSNRFMAHACMWLSGCLLMPSALALPTGWEVQSGDVTFHQDGNILNITSNSNQAIIQYLTFNLANGETVNFILPSASASIINNIVGGSASTIAGNINANGQVAIVNTSGITFASTAQVRAMGFLASTLRINGNMNGSYSLVKDPNAAPTAVNNQGYIEVQRGQAVLAGSAVSNTGTVIARDGHIALAVGDEITVHFSNNTSLSVTVDEALKTSIDEINAALENSGTLQGHTVDLQARLSDGILSNAVNNSGTIEGTALVSQGGKISIVGKTDTGTAVVHHTGTLHTSGDPAGKIRLEGDDTRNSGRMVSIGTTGHQGGLVEILGNSIQHTNAFINVSGDAGGGTILIGGDLQGQGGTRRAHFNTTDAGTLLKADAITTGNGGKIINWADGGTYFFGQASARGGNLSGNGGLVEVSGKLNSGFNGFVDTRAPMGEAGWLLLDPTNIVINNGSGTNNATTGAYYEQNLESQASNINLSATNNITLNNLSDNLLNIGAFSLTLNANTGSITFLDAANDRIRTQGSAINLISGTTMALGRLDTTGSAGTLNTGSITLSSGGNITATNLDVNTGAINVTTTAGSIGTSATPIQIDAGSLNLNLAGNGYFQEANAITAIGTVGGNFQLRNTTGNLTINNLDVVGTTDIQGTLGANSSITGTGNIFRSTATIRTNDDSGGNITLSGDFQGDTYIWGDVVNLTDTAGNLSLPTWYSGGTAPSYVTANSAGANVFISTDDLLAGANGKLEINANKNITLTKIPASWTFDDYLVMNSTNGGDIIFNGLAMGNFTLQGAASAFNILMAPQGISTSTNGGRYIFNNVDSSGPISFTSGGGDITTTTGGNIFRNSVNFNAGTTGNITFNTGTNDFQSATNAFIGNNLTIADTTGNLTVSSADLNGNMTLSTASGGGIALANTDVTGITSVTLGGGNADITGNTGLIFRGAASFNTADNSGGDITLTGDFQGNTSFTGDLIQATDSAGNFTVTGINTGSNAATSTLTANAGNSNLSISGINLDSTATGAAGRLDASADKNVSVDGTGWNATGDILNVWSRNAAGGNISLSNITTSGVPLTGTATSVNPGVNTAGIYGATNGGSWTLNNVSIAGATSIQARNSISGTGNTFTGSTNFDADLGTAFDINITNSNFGSGTNVFDGDEVTAENNSGNFVISQANSSGTMTLTNTAAGGSLTLSNIDAGGTANISTANGNGDITGSTSLLFRGAANFNTNDNSGGDITLTADFQGNTTFAGDRILATDSAGNFTVTGISTGTNTSASMLTANASNSNISVGGINLNSSGATAAGRLNMSADKNISIDGTGWAPANDILNAWSRSSTGGSATITNVNGIATLVGTATSVTPNSVTAGLYAATNGGAWTLTDNSVTGNTSIQARNTISGTGNVFTGTTNFDANLGTAFGINLTASDFQNPTNVFDGSNVTVSDTNALTVSTVTATGTANLTATGAANDLTVTNATVTGATTLTSGRDITANATSNNFGTTTAATGRNIALRDNAGTFILNGITATGTFDVATPSGGSISLANVDATGTATISSGGGDTDITGSTGLVFRGAANFNTNDNAGGDITLTGDFQGNTTLTGDRIQATDNSGNFTVTGISTGTSTLTSILAASGANGNLSVSGIHLNSSAATAAGRLDISANKDVSLNGAGWNTTGDIVNAWSTNAGNMTLSNTTLSGTAPLTGTIASTDPNQTATGVYLATNGGNYTLTGNSINGNTSINSAGTITGTGNTFTGTTNFDANQGTARDISLTSSNFVSATNAFDGANVTVSDTNALTVSSVTATGTGSFTATGAINDLTITNASVTGNTTLNSGRNITATSNVNLGTITGAANGTIDIYESSNVNINQITNTGATGTTTLYSTTGSVIGKGTATADIVSTGTGQVGIAAGTTAANTGSYVDVNVNANGPVIAASTGKSGGNTSVRITGDINNSLLASGINTSTLTFIPSTGNIILGDATDLLNVTGTTTFLGSGTSDVVGLASFTGAVSGSAGRIGLEVATGNFTSGGLTASGSSGWYGDETLIVQTRAGDILGAGYTASGAGNMRLQAGAWNYQEAGNDINITNVSAAQNAQFYATGANAGTSINIGGTSNVAGHITATGISSGNQFAGTTGGINLTLSSGDLTTALLWSNSGTVNLTASNGSILQNTSVYSASSAGVAGGKTIWARGPVNLTAQGNTNSYINTGVMALGSTGHLTVKAQGDSNGAAAGGTSVDLRGRADGNVLVTNLTNGNTTGDANLGTSIGDPINLDDSPNTVFDVGGTTTIKSDGDVRLYGSFAGAVNIASKTTTISADKLGIIGSITASATSGVGINVAALQGSLTGGNISTAGGAHIILQAGSSFPRDRYANINLTNVNAGGNLDVIVAGSTTGTGSGQSVVITGSKGGTSSASRPGGGSPLGTVSMP